jgi:small subunit ribosomal protein S13
MARIAGINIPLNKRVEVGLTYIYGVGDSQSRRVLATTGVDPNTYVRDLTEDEVRKLRDAIDTDLTVEGDLRRERSQNIKRTKTNARTRKGPKRMSVAGKKKVKK